MSYTQNRNQEIYNRYQAGEKVKDMVNTYFLSERAIYNIIQRFTGNKRVQLEYCKCGCGRPTMKNRNVSHECWKKYMREHNKQSKIKVL
jgi:hypothetical protein